MELPVGARSDGDHDRDSGEALDDLIVHVLPSLAQVVIAGALGMIALILMVLVSAMGFHETFNGDSSDINGWAVFLAVVAAAVTLVATFLLLNALISLWDGTKKSVAEAERRRSRRRESRKPVG